MKNYKHKIKFKNKKNRKIEQNKDDPNATFRSRAMRGPILLEVGIFPLVFFLEI